MKFAISTHLLKRESVADALEIIHQAGFRAAEIWFADLTGSDETPEKIKRISQKLHLNLSLHGPAIEMGPADPRVTNRSLDRVFEAMELAVRLSAGPVVIHPPRRRSPGFLSHEYWEKLADILSRIDARARSLDLIVALETMDGDKAAEVVTGPEHIHRIMAFGLSNLKICLDIAHIWSVMHPVDYFDRIDLSWLHHVHLSDRSHRHRHQPLGTGTLPLAKILTAMNRFFKGTVVIEGRVKGRGKAVVRANFDYLKRHGWIRAPHGRD